MSLFQNKVKVLLIFLLAFGTVQLNRTLRMNDFAWVDPPTERYEKPNPTLFRALSFGHLPVAIDWLFMRFLGDSGLGKVTPGTHPSFYYDLDLATDLDPAFFDVYTAGSNILAVVRGDPAGARDLLLKGISFLKHDLPAYDEAFKLNYWGYRWNLFMLLAYVYLFELDDMTHAAEAFKQAAEMPNAPGYLASLKARFEQPGGEYQVGIRLLGFLILSAKDESVKEGLEKKRLNLYIGQFLFELNAAFQKFLDTQPSYHGRSAISEHRMKVYWQEFLKATHTSERDPWGGELHLDSTGKVASTTPHEAVFGLR